LVGYQNEVISIFGTAESQSQKRGRKKCGADQCASK